METERLLERIAQKTHRESEMDYDTLADLYFQRNRTECAKMIVSVARGDGEKT